MTASAPENSPAKAEQAPAAAPKKRFGGKRVKIAIIVVVVMAIQGVGAALLLPKGHTSSGQAAETTKHEETTTAEKGDSLVEVEIGSFSVSVDAENGDLWNISFKLFAAVAPEAQAHVADAVGERYKARVKQAVVKVIRMSSINDLRDPQLDLLKRNLKTEINNVLPQRYLQDIIVSEIRIMQQ